MDFRTTRITTTKYTSLYFLAAIILASFFICLPQAVHAQNSGIGIRWNPGIDQRAPLYKARWGGLSLSGPTGSYDLRPINGLIHKVSLDSSGTFITASATYRGRPTHMPRIISLTDYTTLHSGYSLRQTWTEQLRVNSMAARNSDSGTGGINIDIPVEIKSKAFQRIFGGDRVGLTVQGEIGIDGGFRNEKRSEVRTNLAQGANTNFKMNQTQRFSVTGRIGEKVTVNVDQDSERTMDFENNLKLNYKGFEDEIVQSITAGNISLTLPGTRFVTFSGKSTGLFGIKTEMQLGDLHMTAIASQEKGESQKLSIDGGATSNEQIIKSEHYVRDTYFFISDVYRSNYSNWASKWQPFSVPNDLVISRIEVYKSKPGYHQNPEAVPGWAIPNTFAPADTLDLANNEVYRGHFLRLEPGIDYFVQNDRGYIVMNQRMQDEDVLAVAYSVNNEQVKYGDIDYIPAPGKNILLQMIKPQKPQPSYKTWDLEWKNVYSLGSRNMDREGFELKIFRRSEGGTTDQESQGSVSYLEIFGLDVSDINGNPTPDGKIDDNPYLIDWARGELIMPWLRPFSPEQIQVANQPVSSVLDPQAFESVIYDTTNASVKSQASNFYFKVKSSSRSSSYSLGFNVIEGSEEVILNGSLLNRGSDYTIDYMSGSLIMLNDEARLPTAKLDITFERNQFFQLQKKTILGTRAEYRFSDRSFLGGTFLYLNERTLDQKVQVGSGPMRNLVWDINGLFEFAPNFLTKAVDALPFVRADQPSKLKFEGEIAQIIPNPNTLNNPSTDDNQGVAYIDDFEGSKRTTPFGVSRKGWTMASAPVEYITGPTLDQYQRNMERRGSLVWYNPFRGALISDIWPNREVTSQTARTTEILTMQFTPKEDQPANSWAGVMRALSPGFFDQTESKFLEVMIKGDTGVVHIDLGQISEDVIPNRKYDTEDNEKGGIREGNLDPQEDTGLDRMNDDDPRAVAAGGDFWDINENGQKDDFEPWSNDNWDYVSGSIDYGAINGTENSANDGIKIPDTEDLNGNGTTDFINNYFSYKFDLDKLTGDTDLIVGGEGLSAAQDRGWRLYRIPINAAADTVGVPNLALIENVRVWVDGVNGPANISIAEINLTGNDWREYNPQDSRLAISVLNTHDNPGNYIQPAGVSGVRDRVTRALAREQALVLKVNELEADSSIFAQKAFFATQNFIHYKRMKLFVFANDQSSSNHIQPVNESEIAPDDSTRSDVVFFLRFGSNENNYYEIRERVYGGMIPGFGSWDRRNAIDIELADLTSIKFDTSYANYLAGRASDPDSYFEKEIPESGGRKWYRIKGEPSLRNIRVIFAGVENKGDVGTGPYTGEIWLNELRLSNIEKDKGIAMRARFDLAISDVITVNGELNKQDADFHNIATRFGSGDNKIAGTLNGSIKFGRFLPRKWGINLPLNLSYSKSEATPKYIPGSDIFITPDTPEEELEVARSTSRQKSFSLSFSKSNRSKNFFVKHTFDNLRASISNTSGEQSNANMEFSRRWTWNGNIDYNLQFGQKTFIQPLKFMSSVPLFKGVGKTKLYYLPRSFATSIKGVQSSSSSKTRLNVRSYVPVYDITRSYTTTVKIFENLTGNFARSWSGDFRAQKWRGLFSGEFEDVSKTQSFKTDYAPQIFSWFSNRFSYSSNYRFKNNLSQQLSGRSATNSSNINATATLKISQIFKKSSSSTRNRGRRTPPGRRTRPGQRRPSPKEEEPAEKEKKSSRNPLVVFKAIGNVLGSFNDIALNYAERSNVSRLGLDVGNPALAFQFGRSNDTGIPTVDGIAGNTFSTTNTRSMSASSGLRMTRNVDLKLRYAKDEQSNRTTQYNGNFSESWLRLGDFNMAFPEWTINITGLEKLKFFKKATKTVSISHNFTGKRNTVWKDSTLFKTKEDFSISFRPLLKLNVSWKNGMVSNLQIERTRGFNDTFSPSFNDNIFDIRQVGGQRTTQQSISFSTTYSKRAGFRIPLPFLKNKQLKNSVDFSLTFKQSNSLTESVRGDSQEYVVSREQKSWTFEPRATYSFSNRVSGGTHFQLGKTSSTLAGDVSIKEFGINVRISIRGN